MRIAQLEIKNYRSIKHLSINCGDLVTLLGPNNHGKSNLLTALEFGLTTSAKPVELDFFAGRAGPKKGTVISWFFSALAVELSEKLTITFFLR
ncbi:MAG: AAA family ATPase [Acidobacteriota bacterium]|nr:AAA family ATPase [Acidobacteriota bacterium]